MAGLSGWLGQERESCRLWTGEGVRLSRLMF